MNHRHPMLRRHAMISIEFMTALLLLLATSILFLDVTARRIRVANTLTSDRATTRLAEQTVLSLRASGYTQAALPEGVTVRRLGDPAPAAMAWVEVQVQIGNRKATLVGLVPVKEAA